MQNIVITGGTGLVGKQLSKLLADNNFSVTVLTRGSTSSVNNIKYSYWDVENKVIDVDVITKADCIIHLAGEGISNSRWTKTQQKKILKSRVDPLALIYSIILNHKNQLKTLISASGIGYYGAITSSQIFNEEDSNCPDFLGKTCEKWEQAVDEFNALNIRTVKLRTGIVLSKDGGALSKMIIPFKWGLGSGLGSGNQYMPWIHIDDLCSMYLAAVKDNNFQGVYNASVNDGATNVFFAEKLAESLGKKIVLSNIPSFVLKLIFGKMAVILLEGSRVSNEKVKASGYMFKYENLQKAFLDLV